jgi:hypothetical protein
MSTKSIGTPPTKHITHPTMKTPQFLQTTPQAITHKTHKILPIFLQKAPLKPTPPQGTTPTNPNTPQSTPPPHTIPRTLFLLPTHIPMCQVRSPLITPPSHMSLSPYLCRLCTLSPITLEISLSPHAATNQIDQSPIPPISQIRHLLLSLPSLYILLILTTPQPHLTPLSFST